jgi:hypothetical protein
VVVSGYRLPTPFADNLYGESNTTPTLHIIGRNDVVIAEERSDELTKQTINCRVEKHDGGASFSGTIHASCGTIISCVVVHA